MKGLSTFNLSLLQANCGIADIIARCMRYHKDERTRDADALLNELRMFSFAGTSANQPNVEKCVKCLLGKGRGQGLFPRMLQMDVAKLRSRAEDMQAGILEVSGGYEDLRAGMTTYLSVLQAGDTFIGRTTPRFWGSKNMGINGRFLSMIKLVAQRGVTVKIIVLVCDDDWKEEQTEAILKAHFTAMKKASRLGFFYESVTAEERENKLTEKDWEGCYAIASGKVIAVQLVYDTDDVLRTVRFVRDEARTARRRIQEADREISGALSVSDYLAQRNI